MTPPDTPAALVSPCPICQHAWPTHQVCSQCGPHCTACQDTARAALSLRAAYVAACQEHAYNPRVARARFAEYDAYRAVWCSALYDWLYGENHHQGQSLSGLAWHVAWDTINEQGKFIRCLDFNERRQKLYLGDGLLLYLGLLKDEIERVYEEGH